MSVQTTRRKLLKAGGGIAALGGLPGGAYIGSALAANTKVRVTAALRDATQGMSWCGTETGIFKKVETIHAFKTQPDVYIPVLQRFLNISDRKIAEDLHKFHVPLFPQAPRVALAEGILSLRDSFSQQYPAAQKLQESDFVDSSFIDELEQSGFIKRLYGGDARR